MAAHFFAGLVFCQLNFLNQLTRRSDKTRTGEKGEVGMGGWRQGGAPQVCMDPQPQEFISEVPPPGPHKKGLCLLNAPSVGACAMGQSRQHLCLIARSSAVSPGRSNGSVGWGGMRVQGGVSVVPVCEGKVMSLMGYRRLRAGKLLSPLEPFQARQSEAYRGLYEQ